MHWLCHLIDVWPWAATEYPQASVSSSVRWGCQHWAPCLAHRSTQGLSSCSCQCWQWWDRGGLWAGVLLRNLGLSPKNRILEAFYSWERDMENSADPGGFQFCPLDKLMQPQSHCSVYFLTWDTAPVDYHIFIRASLGVSWLRGKESTCQCKRHGFDPCLGKIPHAVKQLRLWATTTDPVLWSLEAATTEPTCSNYWAHVQQLLSPRAATTEPTCSNYRSLCLPGALPLQKEAAARRSPCGTTREQP